VQKFGRRDSIETGQYHEIKQYNDDMYTTIKFLKNLSAVSLSFKKHLHFLCFIYIYIYGLR
jgi:hypothetical protein